VIAQGVISIVAAVLAGVACAAAILLPRRGVVIPALFVQFGCAATLLSSLPVALAIAYAAVGACVCGILAVTKCREEPADASQAVVVPSGLTFRLVAVLLVGLASAALSRQVLGTQEGAGLGESLGAGLLFGLGLLHLGLSEEPLRVGAGLLSMLGGFQIGYARVEPSVALHGLLIALPLLIALVVAYLITLSPASPESRA